MTTAAVTLDQDIWRPRYNPWLVAVVVALAAFMEVLDTSIANVALPYMAGPDFLSGFQRDHSAHDWVAGGSFWAQAFFYELPRYLHRQFPALRVCT